MSFRTILPWSATAWIVENFGRWGFCFLSYLVTLFQDPAFPANASVLSDQEVVTCYFGGRLPRDEIEWLRPRDICANMGLEPAMVVGERDRFDVNQGEIGDCWFLAALANLADDDVCFDRVVPGGQDFGIDYCGVFRFRFFRFGEWVEVCVDDRLPARHGRLIYLKAKDPNEFWSPLLEKVVHLNQNHPKTH